MRRTLVGHISHHGMIVGGVGVSVGGRGGSVEVGVKDGVKVILGVRVGTFVEVGVNVGVGVKVGAKTRVGVTSASDGYNSCIAAYHVRPLVRANSVKRAPL